MNLDLKARPIQNPILQRMPTMTTLIALFTVYLVWGSTYLGVRIAVESVPPFILTSFRSLVAAGILLAILLVRGHTLPDRTQMRNALLIGALMFGGGAGMVAFAVQWVASGLAALAVAAAPIWAAIFAGLMGRWPSRAEWIGLLIGLSGIVLLNLENGMQANPIGAMALMVGPAMWAFGAMWSRRLPQPEGFMGQVFQLIGGGTILLVMSVVVGEDLATMPTTRSLLATVYLTLIGTLVGFSAYMYLVRTVRPALAMSYAYINPVIAVILGIVLGAEHISSLGIMAMFVILTGVALVAMGKERQEKTA